MSIDPAPRYRRLILPLACASALAAGMVGSPQQPNDAWLVDLHVHGSLSEGFGSMGNHAQQAAASGFDGIWWTDHMGRVLGELLPLELPFEGSSQNTKRTMRSSASV